MQRLENYIGGKSVAPRSGRYAGIVDPSTGEVFVQAPLSGQDDIDDAFAAAREAFALLAGQHPRRAESACCSGSGG